MTIKEQIMDKINYYTENDLDILGEIEGEIQKIFKSYMFFQDEYQIKIENVFDSTGLDIYVLAVSWFDKNGIEMIIESIEIC